MTQPLCTAPLRPRLLRANRLQWRAAVCCLFVSCAAVLLVFPGFANAQINKCNINGRVVYTDKACPGDTQEALDLPQLITVPAAQIPENAADTAAVYSSSQWYEGHAGYRKALRVSRVQKAPVYIYAYTDWCGFCRAFESQMLPLPGVQEVLSGYVKVRINPEHSKQDRQLFDRWGGRGYPSFWIQSHPDAKPGRARSPFRNKKLIPTRDFVEYYTRRTP